MKTDPRIDAYIERQADFARPILKHIRETVHAACPDGEETLKWSMPHFMYRGEILAGMAAFKAHATFGFWKSSLVVGEREKDSGMGQFGRIESLDDLPPRAELDRLVRKAMELNEKGVKAPRTQQKKAPLTVPDDLKTGLAGNAAAKRTFEAFAPSCQREYVQWLVEAKRPETRARRLAIALEWMAEGKTRNWKYQNC